MAIQSKRNMFSLCFLGIFLVAFSVFIPQAVHATTATPENLIAKYGSAKFSSGTVGIVGQSFPSGIYNAGNFTSGDVYRGVDVNIDTSAYDCWTSWNFFQVLCDPGSGANSQTVLTPGVSNSGTTFTIGNLPTPASQIGFIVIDLGEVRSFDTFQVYQMFSDGKVTWASISTSSNQTNTWPIYGDGSWQNVAQGSVPAGSLVGSEISGPASFGFPATSSRYVLLEFKNDGSLTNSYYLEVPAAKLFLNNQPSPSPTPEPSLAKTGLPQHGFLFAIPLVAFGLVLLGLSSFKKAWPHRKQFLNDHNQ